MKDDNSNTRNSDGVIITIVRWLFGIGLTALFLNSALTDSGNKYWIGVAVGISILPPVRSMLTRLPKWLAVGLYAVLLIAFVIFVLLQ